VLEEQELSLQQAMVLLEQAVMVVKFELQLLKVFHLLQEQR